MSNRDLLKEAIADAKAVKEMAISNAKAALEEAFTPQLKSMLEKKLQEMDDADDVQEEMKDEALSEEELNEILEELNEEDLINDPKTTSTAHGNIAEEEEEKEEMHEEEEVEEEEEEVEDEEGDEIDLEDMTEEDLKAFIEDVVDEMIAAGELEAGDEEMEAPEEEIEVTDEESEEEPMMENQEPVNEIIGTAALIFGGLATLAGTAIMKTYKSFKDEQKKAAEKETAELIAKGVDPKKAVEQAVEKVSKEMSASPNYKGGKGGFNPGTNLEEGHDEEKMEEIIDPTGGDFQALADALGVTMETARYITVAFGLSVPVILGMIHAGGAKAIDFIKKTYKKLTGKDTESSDDMMEAMHDEEDKMEGKEADEMKEALETVEILKTELNEVNLLNSKLLYTNKIFKAKNLTEAQKIKVLTTFDKAESVKEVKLVYETLLEGLTNTSATKEAIKESKSFASKAVGVSPKQPVMETNDMVNRFKKLAGIK